MHIHWKFWYSPHPMESARMTFKEEALKLRIEAKKLRIENAQLKRTNNLLTVKVGRIEQENLRLKKENTLLKQNQQVLLKKIKQQGSQIESLNLMVEELRAMVFGKKKTSKNNEDGGSSGNYETGKPKSGQQRQGANRTKTTYRRSAPQESEITDTVNHPLTHCPSCGSLLTRIKDIIRYIEDIKDLESLSKLLKKVEKHIIASGYCPNCQSRKTALSISPQVCVLGENSKRFIAYLTVIMRLSFEQVRCFLKDIANLSISDGEITSLLDDQAEKLTPQRDRLLTKIRGAPGRHYDETSWRVQKEGLGNYCWISRPTEGEETIFLMGRSRGKGNAEELQGKVDNQVGITDDYAAYDNLFAKHQLCMAHPHRKLRDLAESKILSETSQAACIKSYQSFSALYQDLENTLSSKYQKEVWLNTRDQYIQRLKGIAVTCDDDPGKLKTIKLGLLENAPKYFTCLLGPNIPADNNKAERGLRHIVLKRKSSMGSKTQKGANTMSILYSTLLSAWWSKPDNFFTAYEQMLNPQ